MGTNVHWPLADSFESTCMIIGALLIVAPILMLIIWVAMVQNAKLAYEESLNALRKDPANSKLRESTLRKGREYKSIAGNPVIRMKTAHSELEIQNDLEAACAGAAKHRDSNQTSRPTVEVPEAGKQDLAQRLRKLDELLREKLITDAEYVETRRRILNSL